LVSPTRSLCHLLRVLPTRCSLKDSRPTASKAGVGAAQEDATTSPKPST
jgi:hypothetical protein